MTCANCNQPVDPSLTYAIVSFFAPGQAPQPQPVCNACLQVPLPDIMCLKK